MRSDQHTLSGIMFFLLAAQFLVVLMVGAAIAPGYSLNQNAISDLGTIDETALLFNTSLVVLGILNIVGGYFFFRAHRRTGLFAVFVLAGIGAMGAGIVTLDTPGIHGIFALIAFLFFNIQAVWSGLTVMGPMKAISVGAGAIGLFFLVIHFLSDAGIMDLYGPIGHGGSERMIVYPAILWLLAFSGYLMAPALLRAEEKVRQ